MASLETTPGVFANLSTRTKRRKDTALRPKALKERLTETGYTKLRWIVEAALEKHRKEDIGYKWNHHKRILKRFSEEVVAQCEARFENIPHNTLRECVLSIARNANMTRRARKRKVNDMSFSNSEDTGDESAEEKDMSLEQFDHRIRRDPI